MCPRILEIGPFTVNSFGLMLAIGFIVANILMTVEFKRKNINPNHAGNITVVALIGGVAGSKLMFLLEHWSLFLADPLGMAFSPGGLSYFGGFLLATACILVYTRTKGLDFLTVADGISPGLLLGYGVARLGCHFAGDGDYGFPTDLPWGTDYSKGTFPPSQAFRGFPEITSRYPNGIVPDNTPCHPTPVYEFLLCALLFFLLWQYRPKLARRGTMFMVYLMLAGFERFVIEFLRINQRVFFGMTEYQLMAVGVFLAGAIGWRIISKPGSATA